MEIGRDVINEDKKVFNAINNKMYNYNTLIKGPSVRLKRVNLRLKM